MVLSIENIIALCLAYLIGSVTTAVWVGQIFYGIDVREYGSGNVGATNTFRILGMKAGIPVLLIDILKGWIAVKLAFFFSDNPVDFLSTPEKIRDMNFQLALGVASVIGHIFPVYAGFRGGKGIATLLGIMIAIHPHAALLAMLIFLIIFLVTKYVSLSSITAAISFPVVVIIAYKETIPSLIIFSLFIAIMVLVTHQKNIERLLRREESRARFSFVKRGKNPDNSNIDDLDDEDDD